MAGATRALARAVKLRAGVERVAAAARVRVELAPLMPALPVAGAVAVSLVAPPDVRLALTVYGGDVTLVPGLEAWLASLIRDAARPYVLPGRYTHPLIDGPLPGVALPTGMAFITVIEAADLPWLDAFSPSDAYVRLAIGGGRAHRTRVVMNSSAPCWAQDFALTVHAPATTLECVVLDFDRLDKDDEIGRCVVDVAAVTRGDASGTAGGGPGAPGAPGAARPATDLAPASRPVAPEAAAAATPTPGVGGHADAGDAGDAGDAAPRHRRRGHPPPPPPPPPAPRVADVWLPLTRTAATASSLADEWRRPARGGVGHVVKAARLGAAGARSGCGLRPLCRRVWGGGGGGAGGDAAAEPRPRLHLKIAYHPFSAAEKRAASREDGRRPPRRTRRPRRQRRR